MLLLVMMLVKNFVELFRWLMVKCVMLKVYKMFMSRVLFMVRITCSCKKYMSIMNSMLLIFIVLMWNKLLVM